MNQRAKDGLYLLPEETPEDRSPKRRRSMTIARFYASIVWSKDIL
jgi:hypothetical protein